MTELFPPPSPPLQIHRQSKPQPPQLRPYQALRPSQIRSFSTFIPENLMPTNILIYILLIMGKHNLRCVDRNSILFLTTKFKIVLVVNFSNKLQF